MDYLFYSLKVSAIGIFVVFFALSLVAWTLSLLSYLDRLWPSSGHSSGHSSAHAPASSAAPEKSEAEIPPEVIAAIGAAVSVALGKARIHHIRYRTATSEPSWSRQGRATIMASHVIKH